MILASYFIKFMIFSFIGWLYECTYCTIQTKHWDNRGFLYGPICPIYGCGATLCLFLFGDLPIYLIDHGYIHYSIGENGLAQVPYWQIFLICMIGSAILEYTTSYVLEKLFHAVWWDYSNVPFNLNGRICLPAALGFGVAGIVVTRWIVPFAMSMTNLHHPIVTTFIALLLMFYLGMDMGLTVESLVQLTHRLDSLQENFDTRMESTVQIASLGPGAIAVAAGSAAREAALNAKENVVEAAGLVKEKGSEAAGLVKEKGSEAAGLVKEKGSEAAGLVKEKGSEAAALVKGSAAKRAVAIKDVASAKHLSVKEPAVSAGGTFNNRMTRREKYHLKNIKTYRGRSKDAEETRNAGRAFVKLQGMLNRRNK